MRAPRPSSQRPQVPAGRHHGLLWHRVAAGSAKTRSLVAVRILHLKRHARQTAPRKRHTLLHAPEAGLRGRFIFPNQGPGSVISFYRHA